MTTVRGASFDLFREHGMTTVFGNPGSTELPMLADFPADFDYATVPGLSNEARGRLLQRRPLAIGEALRLPGVRPVDVNLLLALRGRRDRERARATIAPVPDREPAGE